MPVRLKLLVFLFLVPIAAFAVGTAIELRFNSTLHKIILARHPNPPPGLLAQANIATLCSKNLPQLTKICALYRNLRLMRAGAMGAGLAGLFLLLCLRPARSAGKVRPPFLFRPGLPGAQVLFGVLAAIQAALAAAGLHYLAVLLVGRVHPAVSVILGIGGAAGAVFLGRKAYASLRADLPAALSLPEAAPEALPESAFMPPSGAEEAENEAGPDAHEDGDDAEPAEAAEPGEKKE